MMQTNNFFFKETQQQLQEFCEEIIIIGGDFNCTLAEKDKNGGSTNNQKHLVVEEIKKLCSFYNLLVFVVFSIQR